MKFITNKLEDLGIIKTKKCTSSKLNIVSIADSISVVNNTYDEVVAEKILAAMKDYHSLYRKGSCIVVLVLIAIFRLRIHSCIDITKFVGYPVHLSNTISRILGRLASIGIIELVYTSSNNHYGKGLMVFPV